jgi:hypothetical protein
VNVLVWKVLALNCAVKQNKTKKQTNKQKTKERRKKIKERENA